MSWRKEKREHKWMSTKQAKRVAKDHAKHQHKHKPSQHAGFNLHAAHADLKGLTAGAKAVAGQMHKEVH